MPNELDRLQRALDRERDCHISAHERRERESELISIVSHELRTPLTSICGSLGLVTSGAVGELPEDAKRLVAIAKNNCERLMRLVDVLLDIESLGSGRLTVKTDPLSLGPVVSQAIEATRGFGDQFGVDLLMVDTAAGAEVNGDSDRLVQVFTNLLSNAVKHSPPGGSVEIRLARRRESVRVSVSDCGQGVDPGIRDTLFEKFTRTAYPAGTPVRGFGLGLNIARVIVERHNGKIGFESPSDGGTHFYVDLPTCPASDAETPVEAASDSE